MTGRGSRGDAPLSSSDGGCIGLSRPPLRLGGVSLIHMMKVDACLPNHCSYVMKSSGGRLEVAAVAVPSVGVVSLSSAMVNARWLKPRMINTEVQEEKSGCCQKPSGRTVEKLKW